MDGGLCVVHFIPLDDLDDPEERRAQIIWCNSHIRINNQPVFFRKWIDKGVMYVEDLLGQAGRIHTFEYFQNQLNIRTHFLEYCGLRTAIPWRFNGELQGIEDIQDTSLIKLQQVMFSSSCRHYAQLLTPVQFHSRWLDTFNSAVEESKPFEVLHQCTIDRKLRNFQFKLLYKLLLTNSLLEKMHVKPDDLCNFCKVESDSLLHIYCTCQCVEAFWVEVKSLLEVLLKENIGDLGFANQIIMLGYCGDEDWSNEINSIILSAKYFVHCCYLTNKIPYFDVFFYQTKIL